MLKWATQSCRIIGGKWRRRRIHFPALVDIRPTPDRVRETVFNWLAPMVQGASCLDLFSGSGALGFEALSRGASHVTMVDKSPVVIKSLGETARLFNTQDVIFYQGQAPDKIMLPEKSFDIVFLDPPFHQDLIQKSLLWLETQKIITHKTVVYIEMENTLPLVLPENWVILKQGKTRHVGYYLVQLA